MKSFRFGVPMWMEHLPGQHYDVRLTAPDGYRAQRSYSIASSPLDVGEVELTIDLLDDGEVSPYFHEVVEVGDEVELRGPFTSYFVWRGESPVVLVGGGSGVVPLMCMLRHKRRTMPELDMRLVYSVRHADDVIYADELGDDDDAHLHARRARRAGPGTPATSTRSMLRGPADGARLAFVCGSNGFVEAASDLLLEVGMAPGAIRTERYGDARVTDRRPPRGRARRDPAARLSASTGSPSSIRHAARTSWSSSTDTLVPTERADLDWLLDVGHSGARDPAAAGVPGLAHLHGPRRASSTRCSTGRASGRTSASSRAASSPPTTSTSCSSWPSTGPAALVRHRGRGRDRVPDPLPRRRSSPLGHVPDRGRGATPRCRAPRPRRR